MNKTGARVKVKYQIQIDETVLSDDKRRNTNFGMSWID